MKQNQTMIIQSDNARTIRQYVGAQTTISAKNQITLPARIVRFLGLRPRDKLLFTWISLNKARRKITVEVIPDGRRQPKLHMLRVVREHETQDFLRY